MLICLKFYILVDMVHNATTYFLWDMEEFTFREKKVDWYWWVGLITLAGVLLSGLLWKNVFFALFILLAGILVIIAAQRRPDTNTIEVSELGIKIGKRFYAYADLAYFWILEETDTEPAKLLLYSPTASQPVPTLEIGHDIDPLELRDFLLDYIQEQELTESRLQKLLERIGL